MEFDITKIIFMIPALLMAVIFHEIGHGIVAYRLGDPTPKLAGRLTFNPIPHIDPFGSIILPGILILFNAPILFGWAKPVPINPLNFKKLGYRKGMAVTSLAGVSMNFLLAFIFGFLFQLLSTGNTLNFISSVFGAGFIKTVLMPLLIFFQYAVSINVILALFNLLPIPPLDGWKFITSFLPYHIEQKLEAVEQYGMIILIVLLMIGVLNYVLIPPYVYLTRILLGL